MVDAHRSINDIPLPMSVKFFHDCNTHARIFPKFLAKFINGKELDRDSQRLIFLFDFFNNSSIVFAGANFADWTQCSGLSCTGSMENERLCSMSMKLPLLRVFLRYVNQAFVKRSKDGEAGYVLEVKGLRKGCIIPHNLDLTARKDRLWFRI